MLMKPAYPTALEHPRFRVVQCPGSRKLTIFFAGTGTKDHEFHFKGQANESGTNYILVNNGQNEWYQNGIPGLGNDLMSTIETIRAWSVALDAPDIYCVGASMGGSGAALYGCLLGASVLGLGFETKIGLPFSRSSRLGRKGYEFPIRDLTALIGYSKKPFHAYVGVDDVEDLVASAHLRHLPNVHIIFMTHVFHGPPRYLKSRDRLRPLIAAFLDGAEMPPMPEQTDVQDHFPEAMYRGLIGFRSGDIEQWEDGYREAVSIRPDSVTANLWLGRALIRQNRYAESLPYLIVAKNSKLRDAAFYFAYAIRHLGFPNEAVALHEVTANIWRTYVDPLIDISTARAGQQRFEEAISALERVLEIEHENKVATSRIATYRKKLTN